MLEYFCTDCVWFARLGEFLVGCNSHCFLWSFIDWSLEVIFVLFICFFNLMFKIAPALFFPGVLALWEVATAAVLLLHFFKLLSLATTAFGQIGLKPFLAFSPVYIF